VHSLSVGVDEHCSIKKFRESPMPLTNARGAFSHVLGEYILFGILYFAKHCEYFQEQKAKVNWKLKPVELVSSKTLVVVGYGNIGSTVAMTCKGAFKMRVIGVNKFPEMVTKDER
jgi:phosphoglycerate dehydrogenase-like enzyme